MTIKATPKPEPPKTTVNMTTETTGRWFDGDFPEIHTPRVDKRAAITSKAENGYGKLAVKGNEVRPRFRNEDKVRNKDKKTRIDDERAESLCDRDDPNARS